MKKFLKAVFPAETTYLKTVSDISINIGLLAGFKKVTARDIALAVDEAVTNTIKHAYKNDSSKIIEIHFLITKDSLKIQIYHTGVPLSEDQIILPDMKEYMKQYRRGGLGILLMTKIMDSLEYTFEDGKNCCILEKSRP